MTRAASVSGARAGGLDSAPAGGYLRHSELPLASLAFLLPLLAVYEVGTRWFTTAAARGYDRQTFSCELLRQFLHLFGASGPHLPALAVIGILLAWHIARKDPWNIQLRTMLFMGIESVLLMLPLIAPGFLVPHYFPPRFARGSHPDLIVMALGAGIYEELLFRLIAFTLLGWFLKDGLKMPAGWVFPLVVLGSAVAFAGYHYLNPAEVFRWRVFAFRAIAGVYFGILFLTRGFGVTCGTHTAYDLFFLLR